MNDSEKTELTPANDNPWYWLATLYGEQTGEDIDEELVKKNRIAWNRWVAEAFSAGKRIALLENGFNEIELTLFSDIEKKEHYVAVLKRSGRESIALPKPSETVNFPQIVLIILVHLLAISFRLKSVSIRQYFAGMPTSSRQHLAGSLILGP